MKIVWAISGSFCMHAAIKCEIKEMVMKGHDITVLLSENASTLSTRFGTCENFINDLKEITGNNVMTTLLEAETLGPKNIYDLMILAPCTSTVLGKWANADYDHVCTLGAKAMLRNEKPVVVGIASNDILGNSAEALFKLKNTKFIYFVPFYQDDSFAKPNSCISKWNLIEKTANKAMLNKQIQPLLYVKESDYENNA